MAPMRGYLRAEPKGDQPSRCAKYTLFFITTLFWLVAVLILAIGIYILHEKQAVYTKLSDATFDPAALFVCFGGILFLITFCGCVGALRENVCLLTLFAESISLIFALEIAAGVLAFTRRAKLEEEVDKRLREAVVEYRDPKSEDFQLLIDTAQTELKCCGSRSYTDWELNIYFNCSTPSPEACGVPYSCCRSDTINRQCGYGIKDDANRNEKIYTAGCLEVAKARLTQNLLVVGITSLVILVLQMIAVFLSLNLKSDVKVLQNRIKRTAKVDVEAQEAEERSQAWP